MKALRIATIVVYTIVGVLPLLWLALTAFKHHPDTITAAAKFLPLPGSEVGGAGVAFSPTLEGFAHLAEAPTGAEFSFMDHLLNSVVIGVLSTLASVALGTSCAYGFSRFRVPGAKDWLFFILSTRFMPPLAVVAPVLIMYRALDLPNTHLGLIVLYTAFNLSLAVWLMKGFIDEIPKEYEEAALVDGYTRMEAFVKIVLSQAATGIAATAVFCFITAWNEYAFALMMTNRRAQTAPPFIPSQLGSGITDWTAIAAGTFLFLLPAAIFTFLLRKHLLRGVTFGTIRK
jgi:multiple sugar transport system permease protein